VKTKLNGGNMNTKSKHIHEYKKGRGTVDVCICGRFRFNEKAGEPIVEQRPEPLPGPLRFDGCGINAGDEYASRIATFVNIRGIDAQHYGPLFAAAPELLEACRQAIFAIPTTHGAFETVRAAIAKATGRAS
jgi:hypothetical protein